MSFLGGHWCKLHCYVLRQLWVCISGENEGSAIWLHRLTCSFIVRKQVLPFILIQYSRSKSDFQLHLNDYRFRILLPSLCLSPTFSLTIDRLPLLNVVLTHECALSPCSVRACYFRPTVIVSTGMGGGYRECGLLLMQTSSSCSMTAVH
jgi:hypothetical protein